MLTPNLTPKQREMWRVNRYIWASFAFAVVWLAVQWSEFSRLAHLLLTSVLACGFANLFLRSLVGFRSPQGTTGQWGWAFTSIDIVLIAVAVHATGGQASDLWLFYILLNVTETLSAAVKSELLLLLLVACGYLGAVWPVAHWGVLVTRLFFLAIVSAIARRLHLNAEERRRQLAALREQLSLEQEKSRVARELHDGLGRELVNIILSLEVARRTIEPASEQVSGMLEENIASLRGAMNDTRELIFHTRPWTWEAEDGAAFAEQLERYARQFGGRTGLAVTVECQLPDEALNAQAAFALLRIVQESLNNVAKHAQATQASVCLRCENGGLTATVTDNGNGFTKLQNIITRGIGLQSMRERAQDLGGSLEVTSQPGGGTVVSARLPLPRK